MTMLELIENEIKKQNKISSDYYKNNLVLEYSNKLSISFEDNLIKIYIARYDLAIDIKSSNQFFVTNITVDKDRTVEVNQYLNLNHFNKLDILDLADLIRELENVKGKFYTKFMDMYDKLIDSDSISSSLDKLSNQSLKLVQDELNALLTKNNALIFDGNILIKYNDGTCTVNAYDYTKGNVQKYDLLKPSGYFTNLQHLVTIRKGIEERKLNV